MIKLDDSKFTIMFPIDEVEGLKQKIDLSPRKDELFMFHLPSLRVASYVKLWEKVVSLIDLLSPIAIS